MVAILRTRHSEQVPEAGEEGWFPASEEPVSVTPGHTLLSGSSEGEDTFSSALRLEDVIGDVAVM